MMVVLACAPNASICVLSVCVLSSSLIHMHATDAHIRQQVRQITIVFGVHCAYNAPVPLYLYMHSTRRVHIVRCVACAGRSVVLDNRIIFILAFNGNKRSIEVSEEEEEYRRKRNARTTHTVHNAQTKGKFPSSSCYWTNASQTSIENNVDLSVYALSKCNKIEEEVEGQSRVVFVLVLKWKINGRFDITDGLYCIMCMCYVHQGHVEILFLKL